MKVLVPEDVPPERLDAIRAVSRDVQVVPLRISRSRPLWARAARFAARRWVPHGLYQAAASQLGRLEELRVTAGGPPLANAREAEVLLATWDVDAAALRMTIEAVPGMRWVHSTSAGVDRFDLRLLEARGIRLTSTRRAHPRCVAEFVMGLVYSDAKKLDHRLRAAARGRPARARSVALGDLTMGVVGYGAIGREVARLARANGMRAVAHVRQPQAAVDGVGTSTDLHQLLRAADVVVLALPLTEQTRGIIGADAIASMRPGTLLVNVGRAGTLDLDALLGGLASGRVRRAYLDVVRDDDDDVPRNHLIWRCRDIIYTGHSAAASERSDRDVFDEFLENLGRYTRGEPLDGVHGSGREGTQDAV